MDLGLAGRGFLVTGGSRGIGREIVALLLAEGALVAALARGEADLDTLAAGLPAGAGQRLLALTADVRDAAAVAGAVRRAAEVFGGLAGVVAGAGFGTAGSVLDTPDSRWREQFEVKVGGTLHTVLPAIPVLEQSGTGSVVVLNGVTAYAPEPDMAAVSALRAAVANLTRTLAVEVAPAGIRVNAINLGMIMTGRQRARYVASGSALTFAEWCAREAARRGVLLGRPGEPREVAPVAALLLSPLSSYVTGTSIDVSGGSGGRI